jgi:hypothetical protein
MNEETADRTGVVLTGPHGGGAAGFAPSPAGPIPTERLEEDYQKIGWWKGAHAMPEARAQVRDFWRLQGGPGLRWLAARLRPEGHIDALDGVASLLAAAGETAILPILEELERQPTRDQAGALLHALAWIGEDGVAASTALTPRLEAALASLWQHDADLREWVVCSARLLPRAYAVGLLRRWLDGETDAEVRRAIGDVLGVDAMGRS